MINYLVEFNRVNYEQMLEECSVVVSAMHEIKIAKGLYLKEGLYKEGKSIVIDYHVVIDLGGEITAIKEIIPKEGSGE